MISMIAACDKNRLIGKDNDLPWRLPKDLAYFMRTTLHHTVVMGRKNYLSLKSPLKNRRNVVMSRDRRFQAPGCEIAHSVEEVLQKYASDDEELFIIGGEQIYQAFLPHADRLYLTWIDHEFEGDTYFPAFDPREWKVVSVTPGEMDENNRYPHSFYVYERVSPAKKSSRFI